MQPIEITDADIMELAPYNHDMRHEAAIDAFREACLDRGALWLSAILKQHGVETFTGLPTEELERLAAG